MKLFFFIAALVPTMVFAQTDIAVEDTGVLERPLAEGQIIPQFNYVHTILWTDSGADSYDVYVSEAPITDVGAPNVYQVGDNVAAGQQVFEYPIKTPHAAEVGDVTLYYAVTEDGSSNVTAGANATTDGVSGTREWAQPFFWFVEEPFIDGDGSDWPFAAVDLSPDNPDNFVAGEIDNASDFSGGMAMGVNDEATFLWANMTDDQLTNVVESGSGDIWQGDSIEWYLGYYDVRPSATLHSVSQFGNESDPSAAEPDWQFVIAANAFDNPQRSHSYDGSAADNAGVPNRPLDQAGLEVATVETGSGWAIEARLPHSGMQYDPALLDAFAPWFGLVSPCNYVANDGDDPAGGRQGQLFWAQDEATNNSWNTPSSWEREHVIYDPRVFGMGGEVSAVEASSWGKIKADMSNK